MTSVNGPDFPVSALEIIEVNVLPLYATSMRFSIRYGNSQKAPSHNRLNCFYISFHPSDELM